jgi:3-hydroxyisobutyrate dehydrogenase
MGEMGAPMAHRLLAAGHALSVWGRNAERLGSALQRGATRASSAAAIASGSEAVFLCVTDDDAVEEIVFGPEGVAAGAGSGKLLVDHSTIHPNRCRQLAARLRRETGMAWVDAPVSGGAAGGRAGKLVVLAGGEAADVERARAWFAAYAARVTHLGPVGAGQVAKSCSQAVLATTLAVWAEVLSYARRAGTDPATIVEALEGSWADSAVRHHLVPHMLSGRFQNRSIRLLLKDLEIASDSARVTGSPMPILALVESAVRQQIALGHEMAGTQGLMRLYEQEGEGESDSEVSGAAPPSSSGPRGTT